VNQQKINGKKLRRLEEMYKCKYIFGKMVRYNGEMRKVTGIRFTCRGVLYKLSGINDWIKEEDIQ